MTTAILSIRVGEAASDGKVEVVVDAEIGNVRLPRIGPVRVDAHAAINVVSEAVQQVKRQLHFAGIGDVGRLLGTVGAAEMTMTAQAPGEKAT